MIDNSKGYSVQPKVAIEFLGRFSPFKELGPTSIELLHHLAADHFDMLVVDLHALQAIDVLNFLDQIGREFLHPLDAQDVMRRRIAFDDVIALLDIIAFTHADMLALGDQIFDSARTCRSSV